MVVDDSIGPGLQLTGAGRKLSRQFKRRGMSIFHEIQMAIFWYCVRLQSHV